MKPVIYVDMDGVVADFTKGFISAFNEDPHNLDSFTTINYVCQEPHFFRYLPVIPEGKELVEKLSQSYTVKFLTTPMIEIEWCKYDKIQWVKENFGNGYDVIFSFEKSAFVVDDRSVLIDDDYGGNNLKPWREAGGTGILFRNGQDINKIVSKIDSLFSGKPDIKKILKNMKVNPEPTQKQKESGNYLKGTINLNGLAIKIENIPGSVRWGIGVDNKKWMSKMFDYYGYITGTDGYDSDPLDVFINPEGVNRSLCFVVNQMNRGMFDEHKIMIGYDNEEKAKAAYLRNYNAGQEKNIHSIVRSNTKKIREWIKTGNTKDIYK